MNSIGSESKTDHGQHCLLKAVTDAMRQEPALEAVKINRAAHSVSVATLGAVQRPEVELLLTRELAHIQSEPEEQRCRLWQGSEDCSTCPVLPPDERANVSIQQDSEHTTIARVTCPTAPRFWHWKEFALPKFVPREIRPEEEDEWKPQLAVAVLCGVLALAGFLLRDKPLSLPVFLLAYLAGAWFTVHEVWERLRVRVLDVHFLMLAVAVGSASIGAWTEGAVLLFLFALSGALEHFAFGRTQREIRALFKSAPKIATRIDELGHENAIAVEEITPGMRLLIKPGEQFPVDAEVVRGETSADESNLTGEAAPVEKQIGDTVLAGTLNQWGAVEVAALRLAKQSALQRITELIQQAQQQKAPTQRFTDKFGTGYTYAILGLCAVMFLVWWLALKLPPFISTAEATSAFYRTMTLLVVSSPCALVLSIPSAILATIASAARRGVLFRGGAAVEQLANVKVVAMDKTGTLTTGELRVERIESFPPGRETEIAELACALERLSTHPLARAVVRYGKKHGVRGVDVANFESVTGCGLKATHEGASVVLGRREWVLSERAGAPHCASHEQPGVSEVWLAKGTLLGRIVLRDEIRPQSRAVVEKIREQGLKTIVLTGDRRASAVHLQKELHVDDVRAELTPEQKVEIVRSFPEHGERIAMIGDGVNDAPSLAAADVGVAMGARGSDAALEQADVVLMHDRLENFLIAFQLSRRARSVIRQNLVISLGTVVVLVLSAMAGLIPLTVGVIGHEGSTVVVVMNSLRLLLRGR